MIHLGVYVCFQLEKIFCFPVLDYTCMFFFSNGLVTIGKIVQSSGDREGACSDMSWQSTGGYRFSNSLKVQVMNVKGWSFWLSVSAIGR